MRPRSWLRAGLVILAATDLALGAFAYLFPRSFYNDVPTVSADPPFSQHLLTDIGAFFLAQGVVMAAAAIIMERWLVRVALVGYLTFAVLHLVFHATHLAGMSAGSATALVTGLSADVALPAVLLIAGRWPRPARDDSRG
jgi:hypothetical protein